MTKRTSLLLRLNTSSEVPVEVPVAALASQLISNVPAALMLSGFTDNGAALLTGANIGGLGTLIASMASLISFKLYCRAEGAKPGKYLIVFSAINFALLALFLAAFGRPN